MEYKSCIENIEIKADTNNGHGSLEGYAATFGNFDRAGEAFVKNAFSEYIPDFIKDGFIAVDHNWKSGALPVATITDAHEDEHGLWVSADFHSTPMAQEARTTAQERLQRNKSMGLSLGFLTKDHERVKEGKLLKKAVPLEVSLTNVPINTKAGVLGLKSSLLAGLTMEEHHAEALAALDLVPAYLARERDVLELREKSGRKISQERRSRLQAFLERLDEAKADIVEMLRETEPTAPEDEARKALAHFLLMEARHKGIFTNGNVTGT